MIDPAYNDYLSDVVTDAFYNSLAAIKFKSMVTDLYGDDDAEVSLWEMYAAIEVLKELPYQPTPISEMQQILDDTIADYFGGRAWFYEE